MHPNLFHISGEVGMDGCLRMMLDDVPFISNCYVITHPQIEPAKTTVLTLALLYPHYCHLYQHPHNPHRQHPLNHLLPPHHRHRHHHQDAYCPQHFHPAPKYHHCQ